MLDKIKFALRQVNNFIDKCILQIVFDGAVWAADDSTRWKMRNIGWDNWSTRSAPRHEPLVESQV